jgi:hypothetical protein
MEFVPVEMRCLEKEFNVFVPGRRKWFKLLLRRTLVRLSRYSAPLIAGKSIEQLRYM